MSLQTAIDVVGDNSIGFSCIEDLNDPFECTAFGFTDGDMPASIVAGGYRNRFSRKYALLSLTRQPLNSLMWSHYGDSHQGVVVGIDVEKAGFTCNVSSVIPAQFGEVIYTSSKPKSRQFQHSVDELMSIGLDTVGFEADFYNIVKRAFLYKSLEWGYEEEVRVVKSLSKSPYGYHSFGGEFRNASGDWNQKRIASLGRPIYCYKLPEGAIKEVYLGRHVYKNISKSGVVSSDGLEEFKGLCRSMRIQLKRCEPDIYSWNLKAIELEGKS
nr:DUF2971 domain-containing protein [Pontibacterium sinense]